MDTAIKDHLLTTLKSGDFSKQHQTYPNIVLFLEKLQSALQVSDSKVGQQESGTSIGRNLEERIKAFYWDYVHTFSAQEGSSSGLLELKDVGSIRGERIVGTQGCREYSWCLIDWEAQGL